MLIVLRNSEKIHIIDNYRANEIISNELFRNWEFITWFAFKFDYYIEQTDSILYGEFLKVQFKNLNKLALEV